MLTLGITLWGLHIGFGQGLLAALVADTTPAGLKGAAFRVFNLVSGVSMLLASTLAGLLWQTYGSAMTFYIVAFVLLLMRRHRDDHMM